MNAPSRPDVDVDAATRARFVRDAGWFDAQWYRASAPGADAAADPFEHWRDVGAPQGWAPGPRISALEGQRGGHPDVLTPELEPPDPDDPQLLREIALVAASGRFDEAHYRAQLDIAGDDLDGEEPLAHFCRLGWRLLHAPCRGFDVWWYWSTHLDPAGETLNPFVHHLALGQVAGRTGRPTTLATTGGWTAPTDRPVRRICLFAGFDSQGIVDDTAVAYVRELSRFADVYYLADSFLPAWELAKLDGITKGAWAVRHGCYDFGSYSMLAHDLVGWETVRSYDELLLVNDSCYVLRPLDDVFATMDARSCDWWGLQATKGMAATIDAASNRFTEPIPLDVVRQERLAQWEDDDVYDFHVGSYFLAYRRPVLDDAHFARLLESVHRQRGKAAIIRKYEIGLTHTLLASGHAVDTFVDAVHPFHPLFTEGYFDLLADGFPLLKRYLIYQNHYDVPGLQHWRDRIAAIVPAADLGPVEAHLLRAAPHDKLTRSFAITAEAPAWTRPERAEARALDRSTPRYDHWWAFPVDPDGDDLSLTARAVFEDVRDDPSLHKVVLTRGRPLGLTGVNVTEVPLMSAAGLHHVLRCGQVFVTQHPRRSLGYSLALRGRDIHVLGEHPRLVAWGALRPDAEAPPARAGDATTDAPPPLSYLAVSDIDHVAITAAQRSALYADVWRVGHPGRDLLALDGDRLPADIAGAEHRLRARLAGRRLLLVAPALLAWPITAPVPPEAADLLVDWAHRNDVVVGVREERNDLVRSWSAALGDRAWDLSPHVEPHAAAVLRSSDAVLTDYHGLAVTMATLGRRAISYTVPGQAADLVHSLDLLFPGAVCRDLDGLAAALEGVLVPEERLDARERARLDRTRRAWTDGQDRAAGRLARRVRRTYTAAAEAP